MMGLQVHHVISGSMELGLGQYPVGHPSAWQLHILPSVLAEHRGPLVFEGHLRGPLCAVSVAMVFGSLLSSVLLVFGPVALAMLLLFAFVSAFSDVLLLVFVASIISASIIFVFVLFLVPASLVSLVCVWLPMPFVVALISSTVFSILRVQLSSQCLFIMWDARSF